MVNEPRAGENWSNGEIEYLKLNYKSMNDEEIAEKLGRSSASVASKRRKLGLMKWKRGGGREWTNEEIEFLILNNYISPIWKVL